MMAPDMAYLNNYRNDYSRPVQRAAPGQPVMICAPCSEACMSMGLSGRRLKAYVLSTGDVQLYDENNEPISFPIRTSEAGIYEDDKGFYAYWPIEINTAASTQEAIADALRDGTLTRDQWMDVLVEAVRDTDTPAEAARAVGAAERDLVVRIQEGQ